MADGIAISVKNVSKTFKLPHERQSSIKGLVVNIFKRKRSYERQEVLKDVSFEIKKGEFFGIVGRNGSGKSTMLKMLAGIYEPNKGRIKINGKLTPFIELGVGFNPELTGRENVFLNGALLGFNRKEMTEMYDEIVDFAELEKFMDQKLKNYSSGMQVRLAFSIAIRAKSDILLIDEVLAVGDAAFQAKCIDYFYELKKRGSTVVFVSHDRAALERFCERGVLINNGQLIERGPIKKILASYTEIVLDELDKPEKKSTKEEVKTHNKLVSIYATAVLGSDGEKKTKFQYDEAMKAVFKIKMHKTVSNPIIGVTLWKKNLDMPVFAINTLINGIKSTGEFIKGDEVEFAVPLPADLNDGEYYIEPAVANESGTIFYDQKQNAVTFHISGSTNPYSLLSSTEGVILKKK